MTEEEFLPLAVMREHCGMAGATGDGDDTLKIHRLASAARIESLTGRRIITINGLRAESVSTAEDRFLIFPVPDFQIPDTGMEVLYRPADMEDGLETPSRFAVAAGNVDIPQAGISACSIRGIPARNMNVPYAAFVASGMQAGQLPPEFRSAGPLHGAGALRGIGHGSDRQGKRAGFPLARSPCPADDRRPIQSSAGGARSMSGIHRNGRARPTFDGIAVFTLIEPDSAGQGGLGEATARRLQATPARVPLRALRAGRPTILKRRPMTMDGRHSGIRRPASRGILAISFRIRPTARRP